MKNVYKISFIKLVLGLIALNCYGQSYLITNEKQIKPSVKNDIVNTSSDFQDMKTKVNLLNSATTQLRTDLNNEINNRQNIDNQLISSMTTMYNDFNQSILELEQNTSTTTLSNTFVLKAGDTFTGNVNVNGNLQVEGNFGVGSQGIWNGGNIYSLGSIEAVDGFTSANQIPFKIMDKTSYLDYNKLFINGNIDITGQYLINGQPIQAGGSGDNLGNHIATTTLNLNNNDIINPVFIKRPYGETPIALIVGDLQNEYYYSISTGSYIGLTRDYLEMVSKEDNDIDNPHSNLILDKNGYINIQSTYETKLEADTLALRTNNFSINTLDEYKSLSIYQCATHTSINIKDGSEYAGVILHSEYDNNADEHTGTIIINRKTGTQATKSLTLDTSMLQTQETDFMLQASKLTFDANSYTYNANNIYGNGQSIEFSNFNNITFKNDTYIGDGSTDYQVYVCSGGTYDGMLTINSDKCSSEGGTAEGTKLFIKK